MTVLFPTPDPAGVAPAVERPWIGPMTPVAAAGGLVTAGRLRPGDLVRTGHGSARVLGVQRIVIALRDSLAPVLLRAPYFAARCDLFVSPDQPVVLSGDSVEYLFGVDEVQVEARHLVDGRTALGVGHRDTAEAVFVTLDRPGAIEVDGCALVMGNDGARPALSRLETAALREALGPGRAA